MHLQRIFSQPRLKPWTSDEMSHSLLLASALSWGEKKLKHSSEVGVLWKELHSITKSELRRFFVEAFPSLSSSMSETRGCPAKAEQEESDKCARAHLHWGPIGAWETLDIWPWLLGTVIRLLVVAALTQKLHPACHGIGSIFCIQNHL